MAEFVHHDLRLLDPAFSSPLLDVLTDLEHLRRLEMRGSTPLPVFLQLKQVFHLLESLASARQGPPRRWPLFFRQQEAAAVRRRAPLATPANRWACSYRSDGKQPLRPFIGGVRRSHSHSQSCSQSRTPLGLQFQAPTFADVAAQSHRCDAQLKDDKLLSRKDFLA